MDSSDPTDTVYEFIHGKYPKHIVQCVLRHYSPPNDLNGVVQLLLGGIHVDTWLAKDEMAAVAAAAAAAHDEPIMKDCLICLDTFDVANMYTVDCPSSHRFDFSCIRQHATMQIQGSLLVSCPAFRCGHVINPQELRHLGLDPALEESYERLTLNRALTAQGALGCPTPECTNFILCANQGEQELAECEGCGSKFCSLCLKAYHFRHTCKEAQQAVIKWIAWNEQGRGIHQGEKQRVKLQERKQLEKARAENAKRNEELKARHHELVRDEKWKTANTRRCPSCKRVVEKIEGCNSMRCGRDYHGGNAQNGCGASFQWTNALPYSADVATGPALEEFVMPAPSSKGKSHGPYVCDNCSKEIVGIRFSCIHCPVFDLCKGCKEVATSQHEQGQIFSLIV